MASRPTPLLPQVRLAELMETVEQNMQRAITEIEPNRLLNTSVDDLVAYFDKEYRLLIPHI